MGEHKFTIGRARECDIVLADDTVGRYHAELLYAEEGKFFISDCQSTNGTWLRREGRGKEVKIHQENIFPNDVLRFGKIIISVNELLDVVKQKITLKPKDPIVGSPKIFSDAQGKKMERCSCGALKSEDGICPVPGCTL
jgi:pSer/pThr/pTyr-binding forkhead associated (FHA) protein